MKTKMGIGCLLVMSLGSKCNPHKFDICFFCFLFFVFSFFHFLVMHICDFKCFDKNPRLFLNVRWLVLLNRMVSVINFESR